MKKIVSVVLLVSLLVLMVVGCSDDNMVQRTIVIQNDSGVDITNVDIETKFMGDSRNEPNSTPVILDGKNMSISFTFDKNNMQEIFVFLGVSRTTTENSFGNNIQFRFNPDNNEDILITVTLSENETTFIITHSGDGYLELELG